MTWLRRLWQRYHDDERFRLVLAIGLGITILVVGTILLS
jgi:hypothetical protein